MISTPTTIPGRALAALVALALTLGVAAGAAAGVPTDQVKGGIDRVLQILQDPALKQPGRTEERRQQIRTVANGLFDWEETGRRALGRHWPGRSPAQQKEFSALFADLIERSYVGKIEAYSGEKILYLGDTVDGDQATVRTRLVTKAGTEIPIDYRLHRQGDRWRAYDVLIEGVSLVANYRNQFNRIIQQAGFDDLMQRLKTKQEEVQFEEKGKK
jgi:phospholipid transport system substrate-binding protein